MGADLRGGGNRAVAAGQEGRPENHLRVLGVDWRSRHCGGGGLVARKMGFETSHDGGMGGLRAIH